MAIGRKAKGEQDKSVKRKAYLETTVVSYLTARPSRDVVVAGHQQVTQDWWASGKNRFDVLASELVVEEASAGDEAAARAAGYEPPIICTPEELLEVDSDVG
jgi:hypothetical protein